MKTLTSLLTGITLLGAVILKRRRNEK